MNKKEIIKNHCFTELVYKRIKLSKTFQKGNREIDFKSFTKNGGKVFLEKR